MIPLITFLQCSPGRFVTDYSAISTLVKGVPMIVTDFSESTPKNVVRCYEGNFLACGHDPIATTQQKQCERAYAAEWGQARINPGACSPLR